MNLRPTVAGEEAAVKTRMAVLTPRLVASVFVGVGVPLLCASWILVSTGVLGRPNSGASNAQRVTGSLEPIVAEAQVGSHPYDALNPSTAFGAAIKKQLGEPFERFRERLVVASVVTREDSYIVGAGNLPHAGGIDTAAFAVDVRSGKLTAVWQEDERLFIFGVTQIEQLPASLKSISWIDSHVHGKP